MTEPEPEYVRLLLDLADEIADLTDLPPAKLAIVLARWLDRQSSDSAEARLRGIRAAAILAVVDVFGGREVRGAQVRAAATLGMSEQSVSRALLGTPSR